MLDPCFTAMLEGAVMANNPPAGLSAVPQDGSDGASAINALFAALPHANTNTRNIYFNRPSTRYGFSSRLDITVNGTAVLCCGVVKITLKNLPGDDNRSLDTELPWFRGNALSPSVRMDNVEHVHWHGGGMEGRAGSSPFSLTQALFQLGTARFCVISNFYGLRAEQFMVVNGLSSGQWAEFCVARDSKLWRQGVSSGTPLDKRGLTLGDDPSRATNGKARLCGGVNCWGVGNRYSIWVGPNAEDCFYVVGYSESNIARSWIVKAGAQRFLITGTNQEGNPDPSQEVEAGTTATSLGMGPSSAGTGEFYGMFNG